MKANELTETVGISNVCLRSMLHEYLSTTKLCPRRVFVAFAYTWAKTCRKDVSTDCLALYKRNPTQFLGRFITFDETWIQHTPETKQQSTQSITKGEQL